MAEALILMLLEKLASVTFQLTEKEVRLVLDVEKEVEEFSGNLEAIQAVLEDAEQKQVKDASVRNWLDKLKEVSFKMDDVLDEWNTEILRQKVESQETHNETALVTKKKVWISIPSHCFCFGQVSRVILRRDIALIIKDLNDKLTVIANQRQAYNLQSIERSAEQPERKKSSSFVDISKVFGRDNEKDILISRLLSENSQEEKALLVIPIIGMGGVGKTTLTQLVYNDENVKSHFEMRIWVCVSDPFDEIKIAKAITDGNGVSNSDELEAVLQCMSKSIEGKKFLLVLDDVWTQNHTKWEQLELPLMQNCGKGSRIIVTTRKEEVAIMMGATPHMMHLKQLSMQNCLSLFNHIVFLDRKEDESTVFRAIGEGIVKKCKGLPLAAKTLASLMRYKKTMKEWQDVLDSKIWDIEGFEQQVFQPLFLSYHDLAPAVRRCLLYCAAFPKDYVFDKNILIELWMSQDYLHSRGNHEKEVVGQIFFDNLVRRSFFQDLVDDEFDMLTVRCKMHDIVHDFVQSLTEKECVIMELSGANNKKEPLVSNKLRHFTLMSAPEFPSSMSSQNYKNLRTLTTFNCKISAIDLKLISELRCLRTLNLSHNGLQELPQNIGDLIHLRYLDLSFNRSLKKLPTTLGNLFNLQTLRLLRCRALKELPKSMGKLINLRHLYIQFCDQLKYLPKGIGRLTSLQTLDMCPVYGSEDDEAFKLGDLGSLDQLQGALTIKVLGDWKDANEAENARLWNKKQLFYLGVDTSDDNMCRKSNVKILNLLRPHQDLNSLEISVYDGTTWPNWIMSLYNLRVLSLDSCACEFLPPLGKLPFLEKLSVSYMARLKKVGVEFLGIEEAQTSMKSSKRTVLFPKLKQLLFWRLVKLEEWNGMEGWKEEDSDITIMPCLSSLRIMDCSNLRLLPDFLQRSQLQSLEIIGSWILARCCEEGRGREWPKISHIPNIKVEYPINDFRAIATRGYIHLL
ncbi:putative disease resistance protein RGA3 isoform X1 [Rosa rugosa]|uniref:putative disease resistance protein RGA3 isoform X1 n=1 Tax=Rosa rugosa TaxID=74645 RepID=UPI002B41102E|nr:putative disease resistance protein RGA3 isoform X1 [Rosa rugosa]XP_062013476.1 putative disease resistance protein RGA3 isoform X1 [Rosa rugosa]XP_062013477.1 putative disease resistance protein RGA3 isoform X1 [Rosa rugosa]XP_062013478.1 putative disease resistance protein RGA3 isoform X1 [Rosa rugosa]XP_062013479.1 putative disease resistance protein RGA3 isoform X1 [Rosa rugosa]XP_062013480.1 putative disease resistance protein RGA3 isoform X1 [Rosa rugosa]XP_062013481.1 putative disea